MRNSIFILIPLTLLSCTSPTGNRGKLPENVSFEQDTIVFKQIPVGSEIVQTIRFENTSGEPVKIKNVGAECGCTVVSFDKQIVQPGKSGEIKVTYTNKEDTGTVYKPIVVELNTQDPYHFVYLKAEK